ncbi:MAG: hypothetical protein JW940_19785 [Polyangiaceae bacterium]|nr:hypothetical protein [Polyangiaceae bacterium]
MKDPRRWPLDELHQLFEAVAAYTDATAGNEMIHRCVAGCVSGLHEYLADQGKHVPPDTVHEARCLEVLLFENFDLPLDDQGDRDAETEDETGEDGDEDEGVDETDENGDEDEGVDETDENGDEDEGVDETDEDEGVDETPGEDEEDAPDDSTEDDDRQVRRDDEETP